MEDKERVNVLIVDDDPAQVLALVTILDELNLNIVRADSGKAALRYLLNMDFAVIILDVKMPMMDGFETAAKIRQRKRSEMTPIIFITAFSTDEMDVERGYKLGAVDYIFVPVIPEILRGKVTVFVKLHKMTMELKLEQDQLTASIKYLEQEIAERHQHPVILDENILKRNEYLNIVDTKKQISILMVDDNPKQLFSLEAILGNMNLNIVKANSGYEALRQVLNTDFAVILLDINMPGMDGFETAELIRQRIRSENTPIIFITSYNSGEMDAIKGYKLGGIDFLYAPVIPEILRAKVTTFVKLFEITGEYKRPVVEFVAFIKQLSKLIAERKSAFEIIDEERERKEEYLDIAGVIILILDVNHNVSLINRKGCTLLGCEKNEIMDKNWFDNFIPQKNAEEEKEVYRKTIAEGKDTIIEYESTVVTRSGEERIIYWHNTTLKDKQGNVCGILSSGEDITERKKAEAKITYMAYYDMLTGLPNRTLFEDRLQIEIAQASRNQQMVALLYLDVDNFKTINDTLGHFLGDILLKEIGNTIKENIRQGDTVARMGGDEFVVILSQIENIDDAIEVATKLLKLLSKSCYLIDFEIYSTVSIGIAIYPKDGKDSETLLKNADAAMFKAKDLGKDSYQMYDESLNVISTKRLIMERNLRYALEREELLLYYQPIVELSTGRIIGVEALIRWVQPEMGLVPPMDFIPLAEDTGMILAIDDWVLRHACKQNVNWQKNGLLPPNMAVNISAREFQRSNLRVNILAIIKETGINSERLEMEITETAMLQNFEQTLIVLRELNEAGINVALDDFGTGYSSLTYLSEFHISSLKLDRSFVHDITNDCKKRAISEAVIGLAHNLGIIVTAEGVETQEQLELLKTLKCDRAQGYLFSKPLPADELESFCREKGGICSLHSLSGINCNSAN